MPLRFCFQTITQGNVQVSASGHFAKAEVTFCVYPPVFKCILWTMNNCNLCACASGLWTGLAGGPAKLCLNGHSGFDATDTFARALVASTLVTQLSNPVSLP